MISVIICSINPELLSGVAVTIEKTIGLPFELLYFDNREAKKSICKVYNELAEKAKFSYLCFVHEDVILETNDWGKIISDIFINDSTIGLIGIAGCKYKSAYFSGWFSNIKELDCANYTHKFKNGRIEKVYLSPSSNVDLQEVVCIDGVFICCLKEAWQTTKFDDNLLKGFHFYDIDFSVRVALKYKVVVTYAIQIVHITSGGDYGNNWIGTALLFHQNRRNLLPFSKILVDQKMADAEIISTTLDFLKNYKISVANKLQWIVEQNLMMSPLHYYAILKFLLYQPLGLKKVHTKFHKWRARV